MAKLFLFLFYFFILSIDLLMAQKLSADDGEILNIYENQLRDGLSTRIMTDVEIAKYMAKGKAGMSTIADFARDLKSLYPAATASKIAVLFYIFNNDTLYRFFIEPGKVKEQQTIPITKQQLEQLNTDILNSLNIVGLAKSRTAIARGVNPMPKKKSLSINFEQAVRNATAILIPAGFNEQYEHLIIIPAFSIGAFPFHLLRPYKDDSYLVDKCSFTIAPGLLDMMAIRKRIVKQDLSVEMGDTCIIRDQIAFTLENPLFVSNPAYPKNTRYIFPDLPGAMKEINASIPYATTYTLLQGEDATKENVLKHIRNCDVAYFATHGMASEENPKDNNFLVLAGEKDPFFSTRDIMSLRDSSVSVERAFPQLVILSACQTGLGKSMEAGITAGIARSFLIAGASQVIMSLWSVDDDATAYLMSRFMFHLRKQNQFCPSEPLRLAQLDTRKRFPNPAHWASFSVFGVDY